MRSTNERRRLSGMKFCKLSLSVCRSALSVSLIHANGRVDI